MTLAEQIAKMKPAMMREIPPCVFCRKPAVVDGPTLTGQWGYMCADCIPDRADIVVVTHIGTRLKKYVPTETTDTGVYRAIERTTLDEMYVGDDRIVECPKCGHEHTMEMDASGPFKCHGCSRNLTMAALI